MDSWIPKTHWAYKGPYQDYPYDAEAAGKLLDEAGWKLQGRRYLPHQRRPVTRWP